MLSFVPEHFDCTVEAMAEWGKFQVEVVDDEIIVWYRVLFTG